MKISAALPIALAWCLAFPVSNILAQVPVVLDAVTTSGQVNQDDKKDRLDIARIARECPACSYQVDSSGNVVVPPNFAERWAVDSSLNTITGTTTNFVTIDQSYYEFAPKDDITAPELAQALKIVLPAISCRNVFNPACDPREAIKTAPENVKRHFAYHEH